MALTIATWNVNGIRARQTQVREWLAGERPDVVCLQEIKAAPDQIPALLFEPDEYWCCWHGGRGYSGVALLVRRGVSAEPARFSHPAFDHDHRIAETTAGGITVASVYVPNGGRDFAEKVRFLEALERHAADLRGTGRPFVVCGDLNVARADIDVHPRERKANAIGQRPEERALFERILAQDLVDVCRALDPGNEGLFTWWAPWRNLRQRNIGWRIDYVLASGALAARATACPVRSEVGTSDHAPVVATFDV